MGWIWILIPLTALSIPIIAIVSSVIEKYIKAQERQADAITEEFMSEMAALKDAFEEQHEVYERRIANLEAIVSAKAASAESVPALPVAEERVPMPDLSADLADEEKVALLAEKLKS